MGPLKNTNPQIPCAGKWGFAFLLDRAFVPQTSLSLQAKNCEAMILKWAGKSKPKKNTGDRSQESEENERNDGISSFAKASEDGVERWKIGETRILKTVDSRQNGRHILDCGHSIPDPRSWMPDNPLCKWPRTSSSPLGLRIESKVGARVPGVPSQAIDR